MRKLHELVAENLRDMPRTDYSKIAGYTAQPDEKVALVNEFKQDEERLLRKLDAYFGTVQRQSTGNADVDAILAAPVVDMRWVAIARTHFQEGWMALNKGRYSSRSASSCRRTENDRRS